MKAIKDAELDVLDEVGAALDHLEAYMRAVRGLLRSEQEAARVTQGRRGSEEAAVFRSLFEQAAQLRAVTNRAVGEPMSMREARKLDG